MLGTGTLLRRVSRGCFGLALILSTAPAPAQDSDTRVKTVKFGAVSLEVPAAWERGQDVAPDEGAWSFGASGSGTVELLLDRSLDDVLPKSSAEESRVTLQWLGKPAVLIEGIDFSGAGVLRFRLLIQTEAGEQESYALRVRADAQSWSDHQSAIDRLFSSTLGKPLDRPGGNRPSTPQPPAHPQPPLDDSAPPTTTGQRTYRHARGGFVITLPEGWSVIHHRSLDRQDDDFDTLWNPRWDVAIVIARVREQVDDTEIALSHWEEQRRAALTQVDQLRSESGTLAGFPAVTVAYQERFNNLSVWRSSFVADGFRYPLTVYALSATSQEIPDEALEVLDSIEAIPVGRDASTWRADQVDDMQLALPGDWRRVDDSSRYDRGSDVDAMWIGGIIEGAPVRLSTSRMTPFASPLANVDRTVSLGIMPTPSGRIWWTLGTRRVPAMAVATAAFPHAGPDGQRRILVLEAPWDRWGEYEHVFRQICNSVSFSGGEEIEGIGEPPWSNPYSSVEAIPELRGLRQFSLTSRPEGVELREHITREKQFVPADNFRGTVDEAITAILTNDPTIGQRLGAAMGDTVPVFDDALRVQAFRNGVLVLETSTRAYYWTRHNPRPTTR